MIETTWGEQLGAALLRYKRATGTKPTDVMAEVAEVLGESRPTIGKLRDLRSVPEEPKLVARAFALLSAIGEDPEAWGLDLSRLPRAIDPERVLVALGPAGSRRSGDYDRAATSR